MFSKNRPQDQAPKPAETAKAAPPPEKQPPAASTSEAPKPMPKTKPPASVLSPDLLVEGNVRTSGDIQIEGQVEGDIRAHLLTVGESATVKGEIVADDIIVNGRVIGRVRGLKVRLTATARVEGDIIHKTIAIESGAHFEGSVQRQEDPLGGSKPKPQAQQQAPAAAPQPLPQAQQG